MRQVRRWHWISAALSLAGMLLFAASGITLNHADAFEPPPQTQVRRAQAPEALLPLLRAGPAEGAAALPRPVEAWLAASLQVEVRGALAEWTPEGVYLSLPRPGRQTDVSIDRASGAAVRETASRGAVGLLNDLHTGRNTGRAWGWFIDIFAAACLVFALTGLALLWLNARGRPAIWPLVAAGLLGPLLLLLLVLHVL